MKAVVYRTYGSPDVLRCEDVPKPAPADDQVLVKVEAASVNPLDWHFVRGEPYPMRLQAGLRTPKSGRLGVDVAGRVEATGPAVTAFRPGDRVFGTARGAFAEYVASSGKALTLIPPSLTFEEAAAVPVAGVTALQAVQYKGELRAGQRVLINGASGGVGTFAVQIAKTFGAEVTGVCSTPNLDLVRSLGADHAIDYTKEDFTSLKQRFDVIVDNVGNRPLIACARILVPSGRYVIVGGPAGRWLSPFDRVIAAAVLARFVGRQMGFVVGRIDGRTLETLAAMIAAGGVKPVVGRRYGLDEIADAVAYVESGHARGKVVVVPRRDQ